MKKDTCRLQRLTPMRRAGKKTKEWNRTRAALKLRFEQAGITACEVRMDGCWHANALSFAHSKKRRNITGSELEECILACVVCHDKIEEMGERKMCDLVRAIISSRPSPVPTSAP